MDNNNLFEQYIYSAEKILGAIDSYNAYSYNINEEQLNDILNGLDATYNNNYYEWLLILTVCKNLNFNTFETYKIFDAYSK